VSADAYAELPADCEWMEPEDWDSRRAFLDRYGRVLSVLPAGARILDCACGTGSAAVALAGLGFEVHGVDSSPAMLARARAAAPSSARRCAAWAGCCARAGRSSWTAAIGSGCARRASAFRWGSGQWDAPAGAVCQRANSSAVCSMPDSTCWTGGRRQLRGDRGASHAGHHAMNSGLARGRATARSLDRVNRRQRHCVARSRPG
jgi:hypothetical protein